MQSLTRHCSTVAKSKDFSISLHSSRNDNHVGRPLDRSGEIFELCFFLLLVLSPTILRLTIKKIRDFSISLHSSRKDVASIVGDNIKQPAIHKVEGRLLRLRKAASQRRFNEKTSHFCEVFGDPAGIRTQDHYIKSVMLYQLSYGIILVLRKCKYRD